MPRRKISETQRFSALARDLPGCRAAMVAIRFLLERAASLAEYVISQETPSGPLHGIKTQRLAAYPAFVFYFLLPAQDHVMLTAVASAIDDAE